MGSPWEGEFRSQKERRIKTPKGLDFNLARACGSGQQLGTADGDIDTKAARKPNGP